MKPIIPTTALAAAAALVTVGFGTACGGPASPSMQARDDPSPVFNNDTTRYPSRQHENAYEAGWSYLQYGSFSRDALVGQLSSEAEQFPPDVAEWAVAHLPADYNVEALEAAESYLEMSSFSDAALYDQLTSEAEQFTSEQADYAMAHLSG
ncbi:hypothetical protein E1181_25695 [Saccharopolyspora terrae]|uniref:Putative host cell surface-exposed lipoprotein Ltp-like HTH region domain-containing protein n=1 Tax=Saccharopolyspora terrae TaxID=2530384 RepID=A0A4R4VMP3_9PSEU|nr:Ltp family lipoprotein [Saccharopolyspora terrae]TDD01300.1 hypothetical protein E1181_25695 [Saccharopolyspora terrae]